MLACISSCSNYKGTELQDNYAQCYLPFLYAHCRNFRLFPRVSLEYTLHRYLTAHTWSSDGKQEISLVRERERAH